MTWNHRIIKHDHDPTAIFGIHEVFYDDDGEVVNWTVKPIDLTAGSKTELIGLLKQISSDVTQPVLTESKLSKTSRSNSKIKLELTSPAAPEQYDAFLGKRQVGYLRLRHSRFRVDFPDVGGETIYESTPNGDAAFTDDERDLYLREAIDAIERKLSIQSDTRKNN